MRSGSAVITQVSGEHNEPNEHENCISIPHHTQVYPQPLHDNESITFPNECIICFGDVDGDVDVDVDVDADADADGDGNGNGSGNGSGNGDDGVRRLFFFNLKNQNCNCVYDVHFECLVYWLLQNQHCPLCRSPVDIVNIVKIRKNDRYAVLTSGENRISIDMKNCNYFDYVKPAPVAAPARPRPPPPRYNQKKIICYIAGPLFSLIFLASMITLMVLGVGA